MEGTNFFVSKHNAQQLNLIMCRATDKRLDIDVPASQPYISGEFNTGSISYHF
ncbi:hypothetical protein [Mucilaginibacter sp. 44-25]|uniref:hypothetical protein n=1 Tax=Mucilaginibacter sp. 44-25 TaxID=1895794 RepID=UPI0025CC829B|nr:hypothetical protein [Mucilaginibacter sp. 44-25]